MPAARNPWIRAQRRLPPDRRHLQLLRNRRPFQSRSDTVRDRVRSHVAGLRAVSAGNVWYFVDGGTAFANIETSVDTRFRLSGRDLESGFAALTLTHRLAPTSIRHPWWTRSGRTGESPRDPQTGCCGIGRRRYGALSRASCGIQSASRSANERSSSAPDRPLTS